MSLNVSAFPVVQDNTTMAVDPGLSKRDYIAIQVMNALIIAAKVGIESHSHARSIATSAYIYADAMLEEGAKQGPRQ